MSFTMQTPQRRLPGAFLATPAVSRSQVTAAPRAPPHSISYPALPVVVSQSSDSDAAQAVTSLAPKAETMQPLDRAARTVNSILARDQRYPELDNYVGQGISNEIIITKRPAWRPFQQMKRYDIPEKILDQYNRAQISTRMGLLPEVKHAWITIDNALYLWDYTHPDPDLIGFEDQPNSITAIRMVTPKPDVFTSQITHVLVVATTAEMILLGLSCQPGPGGNPTVTLYQTRMTLPTRGISVDTIEGAAGRIFFSGKTDNDVYEMTYQQEEKWFQSRCGKINHTAKGLSSLAPQLSSITTALSFGPISQERIVQMRADESRNLLYTLSSTSTVQTFHIKPNHVLECTIVQTLSMTLSNIGHMVSRTDLLSPSVAIVSISPISSTEAQKLHLMATTSTGCRLFMSATASSSWGSLNSSSAPTSMRVQHIKFPPPALEAQPTPSTSPPQPSSFQGNRVDTQSKTLVPTRKAERLAPGYFFCFVEDPQRRLDTLFLASPSFGEIPRSQDPSGVLRTTLPEHAFWMALESQVQDIGLVSPPYVAASSPIGFGNEVAIQFDKPPAEIAVLTSNGVYMIRRRRMVDVLASIIQYAGGDDALQADVRRFMKFYSREETLAAALAVACGQGQDFPPDARAARITGPEVSEHARKIFIEHGGKAIFNENYTVEKSGSAIDNVRPSPRHEAVALYITRLVRSTWPAVVMQKKYTSVTTFVVLPGVNLRKLRDIQRDMNGLKEFLAANRSFIDGLAGPESLTRVSTKQDEMSLQGEHRALHSLVVLISNIVEGISFVLVLFDERVEDIVLSLSETVRDRVWQLTFEQLFVFEQGKELAKELVKAIVNRNIANGSNVDTVADALRRRCGSFCSADDVIIFKAQEQLKKASELGSEVESGRKVLNESLRLFQQVAASLSMEQLEWAVGQYLEVAFYAGAIQLALTVARERDRANHALAWFKGGKRADGPGKEAYERRTKIYKLVQRVVAHVDQASRQAPDVVDGVYTPTAKRCSEAYKVIDECNDEIFQYDLYDWYLDQGWRDRLLAVRSSFVVSYLQEKAKGSVEHADLLWRYFAQREKFHDAATVQSRLAESQFKLSLEKRIEYLSTAKANASTFSAGVSRQARQILLHKVTELLEVANIQDDLLQRLKMDPRMPPERKAEVLEHLDGQVIGLSEMFNTYVDPAGYFDIALSIYQVADHRNVADIKATWQNQIDQTHEQTVERGQPQPYEAVSEKVRSLGNRLHLSENTFPINVLLPMLERYAVEYQRGVGPPEWVVDTFLELQVPYESLLPVLEAMFYNDEAPFQGPNRRHLANDILYICKRWYSTTVRGGQRPFGREENIAAISQLLLVLMQNGMAEDKVEECRLLRGRIEQFLR